MSSFQTEADVVVKPKRKFATEPGAGVRISEPSLALHQTVRNPGIPDAYFSQVNRIVNDDEAVQLRREVRKHSHADQIRTRKAEFLRMAREQPEDLYEQVVKTKPGADFQALNPEIAATRKKYLSHFFHGHVPVFEHPEPMGVGEMWWGETSFFLPSRLGMHGVFTNEGLLMFGNLHWDDGDLYQTGYRVVSSFFLDVQRRPQANIVKSSPGGILTGQMLGFTSGAASFFMGGFAEGDRWSKCRLKLHQRAFAINPNHPEDVIPAAPTTSTEIQLIDITKANDFQEANLPGGLPYVPMEIHLIKNRILRIDLELDLNISLEGDADIRFGGIGHSNPALHQPTQWTLQPF